jgi:hypothetical protein
MIPAAALPVVIVLAFVAGLVIGAALVAWSADDDV